MVVVQIGGFGATPRPSADELHGVSRLFPDQLESTFYLTHANEL
ncbi:MAG: hypothetical protein JWO91_3575 [Acidobacteriaceae bacterium]|nr:hypothetical protein [Acidobacteriaceae bacterium]